jgi:gamma-glutamyltranspeptidase/glutathione hydrolase
MLQAGGNAVDAAIATAAMMTIVEPCSNGLGSDAFCILWDGKQLHGLNASGRAPQGLDARVLPASTAGATTPPKRGWDAVTVPGAVAGWVALHRRFGKLPFADLMAPAIEIAERGYAVPVIVQHKWTRRPSLPELARQPGFAEAFLPHGRGSRGRRALHAFPDAARTLRLIAESQGRSLLPRRDRAAIAALCHRRRRRDDRGRPGGLPARVGRAHRHGLPRPHAARDSAQRPGHRGADRPGHPEHFDLASTAGGRHGDSQHLQIEAMKLAFADVYRYVADPRSMRLTPAQMLDPAYLASRAKLIDPKRACRTSARPPRRAAPST